MPNIYQTGIVQSSTFYTNTDVSNNFHIGKIRRMGNNLEKMRKLAGLTREELGDLVGTTGTTIYRKERGDRQLRTEELEIYAKALNCSPEDLLLGASKGQLYEIDDELMQRSAEAILKAAAEKSLKLSLAESMAYTVKLYKHIREYRSKGEDLQPSQSSAALILKQNAN